MVNIFTSPIELAAYSIALIIIIFGTWFTFGDDIKRFLFKPVKETFVAPNENLKTPKFERYENQKRVPPWTFGDAVKFGFGFGMGMFLWAIFAMVVGALIIMFFLSGGMNTISNFFSPSNTPVSSASGQHNVNNLGVGL